MVYDFDGDGKSEVILKTAPAQKTVRVIMSQKQERI